MSQIFKKLQNKDLNVSIDIHIDGKQITWFKGKDVADALGYKDTVLTSIAVNLFKQLYGQIKNSNYNKHTISIRDDYYPKALQHTFHKEFNKDDPKGEELAAVDIAKDYPSVLLTNEYDIPLYNIHNKIT